MAGGVATRPAARTALAGNLRWRAVYDAAQANNSVAGLHSSACRSSNILDRRNASAAHM